MISTLLTSTSDAISGKGFSLRATASVTVVHIGTHISAHVLITGQTFVNIYNYSRVLRNHVMNLE